MKLKQSFVIVLSTILVNLTSGKKKDSVVPYAINAIIEKHFVNLETHPGRVNIFFFGNNNLEFSKLMDKLLKIKSANTKVTVSKTDLATKFIDPDSSIMIFDSVETFKRIAPTLTWVTNKRHRKHQLVYVPGLLTSDISYTFDTFDEEFTFNTFKDGYLIDYVNFLMHETDNSIELITAYMFTPHACRQLQLQTINRYDLQTLEWENSIFYPNKYENFYGCELIISSNDEYYYSFYNLFEMIFEEQLNAKLTQSASPSYSCAECDLTGSEFASLNNNFKEGYVSDPFIFYNYRILIGPGEPYTDLERMFMMFDYELWIAISMTLTIAFIVTMSLSFASRKIRNFIVGRYVQNPTMNMLSTFLTGSQSRVPGRNFARFIFILFVIWSLIIRTCHQSMLFQFMQADLRRPTVKTLDEFFQSNLTYYDHNVTLIIDDFFKEQMNKSSTRLVNRLQIQTFD